MKLNFDDLCVDLSFICFSYLLNFIFEFLTIWVTQFSNRNLFLPCVIGMTFELTHEIEV